MDNYILLAISIFVALLSGIIKKAVSVRFTDSSLMAQVFNGVVCIVSAIALLMLGGLPQISWFTLILGILFGVVTALQQVFSLKAIEVGPFAYTSVITSLSMIIPTFSGVLFWGEKLETKQIIGVLFIVACLVCSVDLGGQDQAHKKASIKWMLFTGLTFICTGLIGVMQKVHQTSAFKAELDGFLIIAFAFSFVYSLVNILISFFKNKEHTTTVFKTDIKPLVVLGLVVIGGCVAANNKLNLFLSGVLPSAVFYPLVNIGGVVLLTIASMLIFKERLSVRKWIGFACGITAILFLI